LPERIYKLQPNRTLHLRGFDGLGAAAALHSATADSFKVSGVFRDPADFCVLILYDCDNFFEHPLIKHLPDTDFDGLTLSFDVHYSGLRPLDSPRYASIDWPYLDVLPAGGGKAVSIPLFPNAQQVGGTWTRASGSFTLVDNGVKEYDRITLWYLNLAYDYIAPKVECNYLFEARGAGAVHSITVADTPYSYVEQAGDSGAIIAQRLVEALAACPLVTASHGDDTLENGPFNLVTIRAASSAPGPFTVSSTASSQTYELAPVSLEAIAANLAAQINATDWTKAGGALPIQASASGATIHVESTHPGEDGNAITMYAVAKNSRLTTDQQVVAFTGGSSDATWRVTLDFGALGIKSARQMWLTFAPPLSAGRAFESTEWEATFTNWTLSGPEDKKKLQIAGPGSVRIEDSDSACLYGGQWTVESGFYSRGYARCARDGSATLIITYDCAFTHDLYIGTSLYKDRGSAVIGLDGGPPQAFSARLDVEAAVITRSKLRASVPPGRHTVTIAPNGDGPFYFDFLEAAVPGDAPDALPARTNVSPALDYSTDHTYKLSPARLMWILDKLGFAGPMNEYIGVFWWNQRVRTGGACTSARFTFDGAFAPNDQIWISIGDQQVGKTVFPSESNAIFATHFAAFINANFVGVWASAVDNVLTITSHSPARDYRFTFDGWVVGVAGSTGAVHVEHLVTEAQEGEWTVDVDSTPALNRGARDWHADFFRECAARGREIVVASSMELVNPPEALPARFEDGVAVSTDVGFGSLKSTHCAFNSPMLAYQQKVFDCLAELMESAGVTPNLQFGEFCWWYFNWHTDPQTGARIDGGMAFYDDDTQSAALAALGQPLRSFLTPDDDPSNPDALFLRDRLRDHVASLAAYVRSRHPAARFEVLFPYDVNYPTRVGIHQLGGRLLRFVNFPAEWEHPSTAGFDRIKMEGLDFGASNRDLNLAEETIRFPLELGWPSTSVRYMIPVFNGGCPSTQEYRLAKRYSLASVNLWAFDHVCIFGLPVGEPARRTRVMRR
jgi:hypothetical protein